MLQDAEFEARYSLSRSLMLSVLSIGFVVLGLWLAGFISETPVESRRAPDWAIPVIGWLCIAFFAFNGVLHFMRVLSPRVSVRVSGHGIFIADYCADPIPWREFTELRVQDVSGTKFLFFEVIPEREATVGWLRKLQIAITKLMFGMGGSIVIRNTDRSFHELVDAVHMHAPPHLARHLA